MFLISPFKPYKKNEEIKTVINGPKILFSKCCSIWLLKEQNRLSTMETSHIGFSVSWLQWFQSRSFDTKYVQVFVWLMNNWRLMNHKFHFFSLSFDGLYVMVNFNVFFFGIYNTGKVVIVKIQKMGSIFWMKSIIIKTDGWLFKITHFLPLFFPHIKAAAVIRKYS